MTENKTHELTKDEQDALKDALIECPDPVLADLIDVAEAHSFPVLVTIPGATIQGIIIPGSEFSQRQSQHVADRSHFGDGVDPKTAMEPIEFALRIPSEAEKSDIEKILPPRFLNLKDVTMVGNGYLPGAPYCADFFRIPLTQVTGWHLA